jgi:hypothetical protein
MGSDFYSTGFNLTSNNSADQQKQQLPQLGSNGNDRNNSTSSSASAVTAGARRQSQTSDIGTINAGNRGSFDNGTPDNAVNRAILHQLQTQGLGIGQASQLQQRQQSEIIRAGNMEDDQGTSMEDILEQQRNLAANFQQQQQADYLVSAGLTSPDSAFGTTETMAQLNQFSLNQQPWRDPGIGAGAFSMQSMGMMDLSGMNNFLSSNFTAMSPEDALLYGNPSFYSPQGNVLTGGVGQQNVMMSDNSQMEDVSVTDTVPITVNLQDTMQIRQSGPSVSSANDNSISNTIINTIEEQAKSLEKPSMNRTPTAIKLRKSDSVPDLSNAIKLDENNSNASFAGPFPRGKPNNYTWEGAYSRSGFDMLDIFVRSFSSLYLEFR